MFVRLGAVLLLSACAQASHPAGPEWAHFAHPEPVVIQGYDGDAMEPFLTRDGSTLFFNNSNAPDAQTDLHWAERIDDTTFRYRGRIDGANSTALDGVASVSAAGRLCFISTRAYEATLSTVYCSTWRNGAADTPSPQRDVSVHIRGRLMFDLEQSASGSELVVADGEFRGGPAPASADLRLARWRDGRFVLSAEDDAMFRALNTSALEYAAALSSDNLMLAFTRLEGHMPFVHTSIWIARRSALNAPFDAPVRLDTIDGNFVEGPTFSPDDNAIYYHRKVGDHYAIWRVTR